jgi:hypothetical protein
LLPVDILIIGADGLNTIMPRLSFLSNLSHYIELWKYVGERQWFGDEGLKRFYNEYGNVTNVLLGNSASYEMALLDILEPIVRLYSAVGKVKEALTIKDLLEKFDNESDILSAINEESFKNNLPQVHARLSEIKEWFSNGVDEVAGSHSHYAAALSTGVYTIEDLDANYFLSLRFSLGSSGDLQLLRGNELEQFILQLSLIQNENVATANDMQLFIDQYHILMNARQTFLAMKKFGYQTFSLFDFECRAGYEFIKESVELKNMLDENMQGFGTWLSQLRSRYKVSLLYWTEEIHAMFGSLKASPANCIMLMEFTSRLHPLWSTTYNRNDLVEIHKDCLNSSTERMYSSGDCSWLEEVSRLLEEIHCNLKDDHMELASRSRSEIVLHSITCKGDEVPLVVLGVLQRIYRVSRLCFVCESSQLGALNLVMPFSGSSAVLIRSS